MTIEISKIIVFSFVFCNSPRKQVVHILEAKGSTAPVVIPKGVVFVEQLFFMSPLDHAWQNSSFWCYQASRKNEDRLFYPAFFGPETDKQMSTEPLLEYEENLYQAFSGWRMKNKWSTWVFLINANEEELLYQASAKRKTKNDCSTTPSLKGRWRRTVPPSRS